MKAKRSQKDLDLDLDEAVDNQDTHAVRRLLKLGASPNAGDDFRVTVLHRAASKGNVAIMQLLLGRGADPKAVCVRGRSVLMYACAAGRDRAARLLLEHKVDVNRPDSNGWTPLLFAVGGDSLDVVQQIIAHGADVNAAPEGGYESALSFAVSSLRMRIALCLVEAHTQKIPPGAAWMKEALDAFEAGSDLAFIAALRNGGDDASLFRDRIAQRIAQCAEPFLDEYAEFDDGFVDLVMARHMALHVQPGNVMQARGVRTALL